MRVRDPGGIAASDQVRPARRPEAIDLVKSETIDMKFHLDSWGVAAGALLSVAVIGCNPPIDEKKGDASAPTTGTPATAPSPAPAPAPTDAKPADTPGATPTPAPTDAKPADTPGAAPAPDATKPTSSDAAKPADSAPAPKDDGKKEEAPK